MPADTQLRVVIADDDPIARRLLSRALQARGMTVVAEAKNGREAVALGLMRPQADVAVLDLLMPELDGVLATRRMLDAEPDLFVVVLTDAGEDELVLQARRAGAVGVVPKDADLDALARAVESAARGEWAIARGAG